MTRGVRKRVLTRNFFGSLPRSPVASFHSPPGFFVVSSCLVLQLGGAILVEGASATLSGVRMTDNSATAYGGGLACNDGSSCVMTDSFVGGNTAVEGGGGLLIGDATGETDGVVFEGNSVSDPDGRCVPFRSTRPGRNPSIDRSDRQLFRLR